MPGDSLQKCLRKGCLEKLILGTQSVASLTQAQQQLEALCLCEAGERFQKNFGVYEPWMSHYQDRDRFFRLHRLKDQAERPWIFTEADELELLDAVFALDMNHLGFLEPEITYWRVMSFDDTRPLAFRAVIEETVRIIRKYSPEMSAKLAVLCHQIIPIESNGLPMRALGSGLSSHAYRNAIFLSLPEPHPLRLGEGVLNVVHEIGHQALILYQCGDPILSIDLNTPVYSVIRRTDRPAIKSVHAMAATAFMLKMLLDAQRFFHEEWGETRFRTRMQNLRSDLELALLSLHPSQFTSLGKRVYREFQELFENTQKL